MNDHLDQIEARANAHQRLWNHECILRAFDLADDVLTLVAALRAVLELHGMDTYAGDGQEPWEFCTECEHNHPCSTVRAITAAIEGTPEGTTP